MNPKLFNLLSIFILHAVTLIVLCPSRFGQKKTFAAWSVSALLSVVCGFLLITMFHAAGAYAALVVTILLYTATCLFLSSYEIPKTLFLFLIYSQAFMMFTVLVAHLLSRFFFDGNFTAMSVIRSILHICLIVLCGTLLKDKFAKVSQGIQKGWWPLNLMSFLLLCYVSILILHLISIGYGQMGVVLFILLLAMSVSIYWVFFLTITYLHQMAATEQVALQSKLLMAQVNDMQEYIENARRTNHDVRHHNLQIAEYVRNGKLDELLCYLNQYEDELQSHLPVRLCENLTANNILSAYLRKAEQSGIAVSLTVAIEQDIGIKDTHIVAILANIMENAILGCIRSKHPAPFIELSIARKAEKLVIQSRNTAGIETRFENGLPKSKDGNGIGVPSILHCARSYGGETDFQNEGGVFVCRVLLKIPQKVAL